MQCCVHIFLTIYLFYVFSATYQNNFDLYFSLSNFSHLFLFWYHLLIVILHFQLLVESLGGTS